MSAGESRKHDFPRHERVARRSDFTAAYEEGRKQFGRFSIIFTRNNGLGHSRLGVTVTRKSGKANVRNRLKRWVREVYRQNRRELGLATESLDLIVNVRPVAAAASWSEFSEDLIRSLRKIAAPAGRGETG
jgi:ribonuclease P protein component